MNYPSIRFVFDRKNVASSTKKGLLQIEVTFQRRRKWIGTGVHLLKHQWDMQRHVVRHNDSVTLNRHLDSMYTDVSNAVSELIKERRFSFNELNALLAGSNDFITLAEFIEEEIGKSEKSNSRNASCITVLRKIESSGLFRGFDTVTKANVERFVDYLKASGVKESSMKIYCGIFSMFLNNAIEQGYISENPMERIKIKKGESAERNFLTENELELFENVETDNANEAMAKDMFLFQCYTGMSFVDINGKNLKRIITDRNGKFVIVDKRKKTNVSYYVVVTQKALDIMQRNRFRLHLQYQTYGRNVKHLAEKAGIDKRITSHCGRHTFAVIALNRGVSIEVLAKILGHSDIKTTQIYAKIVNKSVEDGFDKLEGIL